VSSGQGASRRDETSHGGAGGGDSRPWRGRRWRLEAVAELAVVLLLGRRRPTAQRGWPWLQDAPDLDEEAAAADHVQG
jgi:hypothetical protein